MSHYKPLVLRPHVKQFQNDQIANGKCWHFDAWLLYDERDMGALYVIIQTREGGRTVLTQHNYIAKVWTHGEFGLSYAVDVPQRANTVTLQDASMAPLYERLNDLHWHLIFPMSQRRPDEFSYSSICLHYITAPSLDPLESAVNYSRWYGMMGVR